MPTPQNTMRPIHPHFSSVIADKITQYHAPVINEIIQHVAQDDVVVVGMAWNPFVKKATKLLENNGFEHTYLEYGSYVSQWKQRLAIKMWSGWPTFPQVFVKGVLLGGFDDLKALMENGDFQQLLDGDRHE